MKDRKYITRSGLPARIICTDVNHKDFPIQVLVTNKHGGEVVTRYTRDLKYYANGVSSEYDLVEVSQWDHIAVDQPVYVKNTALGEQWRKRYFAMVESGRPFTWCNGATSWTSLHYEKTDWDECLTVEEYEALLECTMIRKDMYVAGS